MKNLSFFVSALALLSSSAYAAIDCKTLPTCASLGYNDVVAQCPKSSTGAELVVRCPFDTTQGKCIREAAVGQIAYFTHEPNTASGWLKCDGKTYSKTMYPELATFLSTQFCNSTYHASSCSNTVFAVPNYQGYFLRVAGTPNSGIGKVGNSDFINPQREGLPNITGEITSDMGQETFKANFRDPDETKTLSSSISGAFWKSRRFHNAYAEGGNGIGYLIDFSAQKSNSIYGSSTGVTPPNMAVHAYIYAGKIVQ